MNISGIYYCDSANGPGIRTSLYVSGCTHHCEGCFNKDTWDFNFGKPFTKEIQEEIIKSLQNDYVSGLTLLGGEPFEIINQEALYPLIMEVKKMPNKTIWVYSGYLFEELTDPNNKRCHGELTDKIIDNIDVLVDGEFVLAKKDLKLQFKGSSNQRVIDVQKTLESKNIVLSKYN